MRPVLRDIANAIDGLSSPSRLGRDYGAVSEICEATSFWWCQRVDDDDLLD